MNPLMAAAGKAPISYGEKCHRVTNLYLLNPSNLPAHCSDVAVMAGCGAPCDGAT